MFVLFEDVGEKRRMRRITWPNVFYFNFLYNGHVIVTVVVASYAFTNGGLMVLWEGNVRVVGQIQSRSLINVTSTRSLFMVQDHFIVDNPHHTQHTAMSMVHSRYPPHYPTHCFPADRVSPLSSRGPLTSYEGIHIVGFCCS